ncbi:hypothetical protein SORBI_3009G086600 [Sorghum bicolor]|uniref:Replication factor A C-terminal domain-containing protein n=1 Tax=Sorghum bicolor TaxID=4558 RepID=C5YV70_SORBI|nr:hypothetical protein SORBI_3009G086600 [Sorghum bicolor]OQU77666.1 hypothetical protein SORBI_3009G086600 [Sorghum bicolor]
MQASYLGKLQKGRPKVSVCVRVMRKWTVKESMGQRIPLFVGLVLADAKGDAIYAEISQELIKTLDPLIQLHNVYVISKFKVNNAKPTYKPLDCQLMIELTEFTMIRPAENPPNTFPAYVYALTSFTSILPAQGPVAILTDVLGYITKYTGVVCVTPKGKERGSILREVFIKDLSDNELKITLWGEHAVNFTVGDLNTKENPKAVIALFVGFIPRKWHSHSDEERPYLSGSSGSYHYLNPQITEALPFYDRFKEEPIYIERPEAPEAEKDVEPQHTPLDQKTIAELNSIDPYDFADEGYKCAVTVTHIPDDNSWWYMSCKGCKKKMDPQPGGGYQCPKCHGTNSLPRYLFNFSAKDETGEANFFAYDETARIIIQKDCDLILNPLKLAMGLPQQLQAVIAKKFIFSINLTENSFTSKARRQYLVKHVLERLDRSGSLLTATVSTKVNKAIQLPSTSSAQPQNQLQMTRAPQFNQQVLEIPQANESTPAPPTETEQTPVKEHTSLSPVDTAGARKRLFEDTNVVEHNTSVTEVTQDNINSSPGSPPQLQIKRAKLQKPRR